MLSKTFKMRDLEIPAIGLGTYHLRGTQCTKSLIFGLSLGYKLIDSSPSYLNEVMISEAIARFPRSSYFITTKIPYSCHGETQSMKSIYKSLDALKIDYVDLCLIEWPGCKSINPVNPHNIILRNETWEALISQKKAGLTKHIGVSNFKISHLDPIIKSSGFVPEVNQIEVHPLCLEEDLYKYCSTHKIQLMAHTPLGKKSNLIWDNLDLQVIAKKKQITMAQLILKWTLTKGITVTPKSENFENIRKNSMLDFDLSEDEIKILNSLNRNLHISKDSDYIR